MTDVRNHKQLLSIRDNSLVIICMLLKVGLPGTTYVGINPALLGPGQE
jgi:hypothetical protein